MHLLSQTAEEQGAQSKGERRWIILKGGFQSRFRITYYQLPITNYLLPITYYQLPITHYPLPILNSDLSCKANKAVNAVKTPVIQKGIK